MLALKTVLMLVSMEKLLFSLEAPSVATSASLSMVNPVKYSCSALSASQRLISPVAGLDKLLFPLSKLRLFTDLPAKNERECFLVHGVDDCEFRSPSRRL